MKSMKNFAAQQLTKKQMNEVKGGTTCVAYDKNGNKIGSGNFPGKHVAEATVDMAVALSRKGWAPGSYSVTCQ